MKRGFSACHPAVIFLYFGLMLLFSLWLTHPAAAVLSLLGAVLWSRQLGGRETARFQLRTLLPMLILAALLNPVFSHEGATILTWLPSGNPLTLESILYGIGTAGMLACVICWFFCFNRVVTSDMFLYLFGRAAPALSLILSMVLRLVPRLQQQFHAVCRTQAALGRPTDRGPLLQRWANAVRVWSVLLTWALENAVDTADSMRSRGYGLPGRTSFSLYRLTEKDSGLLCWLGTLAALLTALALRGALTWRYYPTVRGAAWDIWQVTALLVYLALSLTPCILDAWEGREWKRMTSDI